MLRRNNKREIPGLNTAALPDLIFTVLFFFMLIAHMRKTDVKVKYDMPQQQTLQSLEKKSAIIYLHVGYPDHMTPNHEKNITLQLNNHVVEISRLAQAIGEVRAHMSAHVLPQAVLVIRADKNVPMQTIAEIKKEARKAGQYMIAYAGEKNKNRIPKSDEIA